MSLFIFLFAPEAANQRPLKLLSEIAAMLADPQLGERLKSERDAAAVHRAIAAWGPR